MCVCVCVCVYQIPLQKTGSSTFPLMMSGSAFLSAPSPDLGVVTLVS